MRFLLNHNPHLSAAIKSPMRSKRSLKESAAKIKSQCAPEINTVNTNLTKSWGQQCSPSCGCVLRFETETDESERIVHSSYVAKTVVTTIDKDNGGRLRPVKSTRKSKPMFQECECQSLHALANLVTRYLPNKRWDHVRNMNNFAFVRSSSAFRHAVLSEHDLPRTDSHCFDVVEEAFAGLVNGYAPPKRRINAPFERIVAAECLQRPLLIKTEQDYLEDALQISNPRDPTIENQSESNNGKLGVDRNRIFMSTSKTSSTLGMFDINGENWLDEDENDGGESAMNPRNNQFDWVSYVDELHMVDDSA